MNRTRLSWILVIAVVLYFGVRFATRGPTDQAVHLSYTQAVGYGIGELLARDFPDGARVLYLVPGANDDVVREQFQPHVDGIRAGYDRPGLEVLIRVGEGPDAPRRSVPEMMGIVPRVLADASGAVAREGGVAALVAQVQPDGLPSDDALRALPPLYVIDPSADPRWPALLKRGVVKGVVTRNPEADLLPMAPGLQPASEIFALRYRIVSP